MKTRKSILALIILSVLVFMQGQARAFFLTGNDLVGVMKENEKGKGEGINNFEAGAYAGYVTGVSDALSEVLCELPPRTTRGQIGAIVAKYLKNHPERWNESAAFLVIDALKEAFPLPQKK